MGRDDQDARPSMVSLDPTNVLILDRSPKGTSQLKSVLMRAPEHASMVESYLRDNPKTAFIILYVGKDAIGMGFAPDKNDLMTKALPELIQAVVLRTMDIAFKPLMADERLAGEVYMEAYKLRRAHLGAMVQTNIPHREPRPGEPFAVHAAFDLERLVQADFFGDHHDGEALLRICQLLLAAPTIRHVFSPGWRTRTQSVTMSFNATQQQGPFPVYSIETSTDASRQVLMGLPPAGQVRRLALVIDSRHPDGQRELQHPAFRQLRTSLPKRNQGLLVIPVLTDPDSFLQGIPYIRFTWYPSPAAIFLPGSESILLTPYDRGGIVHRIFRPGEVFGLTHFGHAQTLREASELRTDRFLVANAKVTDMAIAAVNICQTARDYFQMAQAAGKNVPAVYDIAEPEQRLH